ncbi:MAG: 50S ribosomal protein L9 [Enterobacteriaceae bacterium]
MKVKIIILKKIKNLGDVGKIIEVNYGYAINYLIPKNKAIVANKENVKNLNLLKKRINNKIIEKEKKEKEKHKKISNLNKIYIFKKSSSKGNLFDSITKFDLIKKIKESNIEINKNEIKLMKEKIKKIGNYSAIIKIGNLKKIYLSFEVKNK